MIGKFDNKVRIFSKCCRFANHYKKTLKIKPSQDQATEKRIKRTLTHDKCEVHEKFRRFAKELVTIPTEGKGYEKTTTTTFVNYLLRVTLA
jgi:hypothetical protein